MTIARETEPTLRAEPKSRKPLLSLRHLMLGAAVTATLAVATVTGTAGLAASAEKGGDLIGSIGYYQVREKETLLDIARLHDLGFIELVAANPGIDPWLPGTGRTVMLPKQHILPNAPREGIVINLPELRLYFFPGGGKAPQTYPLGIGRLGRETPLGSTAIVAKRKDPIWIPPESIRTERPDLPAAVPPGPDNPLGSYAMNLGWPSYVIHGTNKPYGIGRRVSSGCIRMYPEDIERLFPIVAIRTKVTVVNQPLKLGWSNGELYMEVHPDVAEGDELEARGWFTPAPLPNLDEHVRHAAGTDAVRIYWPSVHRAALAKRGFPVRITH
jgi:L,D-transpeptidase ErfK/SrfK